MEREQLEQHARAACESGDHERAATLLLSHYGDELLAFLIARLRSDVEGSEAFSLLCEDLWLGLSGFQWRCSARAWAYALARNAAHRHARAPHQRRARKLTLEHNVPLSQLVAEVRSRTELHRRTETKDRFRELRERLEPDDQMLLILRIDRELSWRDLAQVMLGDDQAIDDDKIHRESSRLRKRFERVKDDIKRMAVEEGLLADPSVRE